jgi:hypothetical protein
LIVARDMCGADSVGIALPDSNAPEAMAFRHRVPASPTHRRRTGRASSAARASVGW